jgi:hypothetical protein
VSCQSKYSLRRIRRSCCPLPRHGRMQLSSLFPLPDQPDIDIGITGDWSRPDIFRSMLTPDRTAPSGGSTSPHQTSPIPRACSGGTTKASARCCSEPTWGRKPTSRSGHSSSCRGWCSYRIDPDGLVAVFMCLAGGSPGFHRTVQRSRSAPTRDNGPIRERPGR